MDSISPVLTTAEVPSEQVIALGHNIVDAAPEEKKGVVMRLKFKVDMVREPGDPRLYWRLKENRKIVAFCRTRRQVERLIRGETRRRERGVF